MDEFDESRSASRPKPSKIPSWIMLGFFLGALFVWALPRPHEAIVPPATVVPATPSAPSVPTRPRLSDVEAVFTEWGRFAVWADNITYVCMWDSAARSFRDCFQVLRRGDELFFRSVPRPSNLRPLEGVPSNSPLEFLNPVPEVRGLFGERLPAPTLEATSRPK
jgi:hypothetical protein